MSEPIIEAVDVVKRLGQGAGAVEPARRVPDGV